MSAEALAQLIRDNQPCVVLTGAGVSTESGIPDFRSRDGIWRRYDPMEYATIQAFRRDPVKVWDFYARRLGVLQAAEPNAAHLALARLEQLGWVEAVVTQNVDRLHERAGSRDVVEVHGSLRTSSCLDCGHVEGFDRVVELLPTPRCDRCGAVLKPDVVMFGELLARGRDRAVVRARARGGAAARGRLLARGSPGRLAARRDAGRGRELAIVNRGSTPYDRRAALVVDGAAGEVLACVSSTFSS